jgi:nucleotide-binding universal stress UspA family protein
MKKIIVPTDFSEQAKYALDLACEIATREEAEIILLHVIEFAGKKATFLGSSSLSATVDVSTGIEMDDIYFVELFKRRRHQMNDILVDKTYGDANIVDKIMLGSPFHAIDEEITENDADIIIMGTTGVNDWREGMIGSTAEKVVRHARCPVLTLRQPVLLNNIHRIVFASDFRENNNSFIEAIKYLQKFFEAELNFVFINTPSSFINEREIKKVMEKFASDNDFSYYKTHVYSNHHEEEGIVWFTEDYKMDLIMMATHGRKGLSRIFEHSIAEDVVNFSKKPVVTFNLHT